MRVVLLAACLVGASACHDDPYGAMIEASGDIEFDHVEVFLGKDAGSATPLTPNRLRASLYQPIETQLLVERALVEDDALQATPNARETRWNYLIPYNEQNKKLGAYVLVVVSKDGQEVGAAEVFDFEVPSDVLHRYLVDIVPLANEDYERWGDESNCVRWTRPRDRHPTTVAIVPSATNADCDRFGTEDCDNLRYCNPLIADDQLSGCYAPDACLLSTSSGGCSAGNCFNRIVGQEPPCEEATCIDSRLCDACDTQDPRLLGECAIGNAGGGHPDLGIALMGDADARTICAHPSADAPVTIPIPCIEPRVEAVTYYYPDPEKTGPVFRFEIFADVGNTCRVHITEPFPGALWVGIPHLVVSVKSSSGGSYQRTRFAFGLEDTGTPCGRVPPLLDTIPILEGCGI